MLMAAVDSTRRDKGDSNLAVEAITDISRTVLEAHDPSLELLGVRSTGGANERAEVVVRISGCHSEPCRLVLNVSRQLTREQLARQISDQLRDAIATHKPHEKD